MSANPAAAAAPRRDWLGSASTWLRACAQRIEQALPQAPASHADLALQRGLSLRVLVADDNAVNLSVMAARLVSRGIEPVLAKDGAEALDLARGMRLDLVLMDIQMPVLNGLAATAAIRRFERARARAAVPVVAHSSACPGPGVLARHGLSGSLSKPCDDAELESCLLQWCASYRPAPIGAALRLAELELELIERARARAPRPD